MGAKIIKFVRLFSKKQNFDLPEADLTVTSFTLCFLFGPLVHPKPPYISLRLMPPFTHACARWRRRKTSSCPINRCRGIKMEHVSAGRGGEMTGHPSRPASRRLLPGAPAHQPCLRNSRGTLHPPPFPPAPLCPPQHTHTLDRGAPVSLACDRLKDPFAT